MKMPSCLVLQPVARDEERTHVIGETGFSFSSNQRPPTALSRWNCADGLPVGVKSLLETHRPFEGMSGLIRVMTEPYRAGGLCAGWMLARAATGLVSIVVRETNSANAAELIADADFAVAQAHRYCASSAIVIVQETCINDASSYGEALEQAFGVSHARPGHLYAPSTEASIPMWFARLAEESR